MSGLEADRILYEHSYYMVNETITYAKAHYKEAYQ